MNDANLTIKFNETRIVDDPRRGTENEERYEAGEIYSVAPASARHWIERGVAEVTDEKPTVKSSKATPKS